MNRSPINRFPWQGASRQRGVALVVSLLLLIIVAIVGLAAMRGTLMQQKMASNTFDREQAFQAAEAALRVATAVLPTAPIEVSRNCQVQTTVCQPNPFTDPNLPKNSIYTVMGGSGSSTTFSASSVAAMQPQYVIEFMGNYTDPNGIGNYTGNSLNYHTGGGASFLFYRITARSGDPGKVGDRAVVTLQTTVKLG